MAFNNVKTQSRETNQKDLADHSREDKGLHLEQ